jgi:hypothetical protein
MLASLERRRTVALRAILTLAAAATVVVAIACSGSPSSPSRAGTLTLSIKDSPFSDAKAVLVTFSEVSVHRSDGDAGWKRLPFADGAVRRICDLKKLETAQDILGTGGLEPGHYTQIRLMVSEARIYFDNAASGPACGATIDPPPGSRADLEIPSGEVKLNREFDLSETAGTNILIDFDGDRSIRQTGNGRYTMTPVISVVSVQ